MSRDWKMKRVDMSERAVIHRLRQVEELRALCVALMKAGRAGLKASTVKRPIDREESPSQR
jgi:hypothetical protein